MTGMMGGGGGGGSSTTTTQQVYSPAEEAARAQIFSEGQNLYNQQAPTAGQYRGPGVVGFSDPTQQAFGTQMQTAAAAQPTALGALSSANFNMGPARYVSSNPYAADAIKAALDPVVRNYTNSVIPSLRLGGAASGTGMGTRQGVAEGMAADSLMRTLANTSSSMASGMYGQGLNASVQTQGQLPQIMLGAQAPAGMQSQVGASLESQAQREENLAAAQRLQSVNGPWELLQNWGGLTSGMSNPKTTTTQSTDSGGGSGSAMQGIGTLLSIAGIAASMFSDEALKEDVKPVGKLNDGQKVYSYKYKGDTTPRIGLIAQEVAKVHPEAVHRDPASGYLKVNYAAATKDASALPLLVDLLEGA